MTAALLFAALSALLAPPPETARQEPTGGFSGLWERNPEKSDDAQAKSVWQGQVEGAPDSVLALVDELSIRILGALLERKEGETPSLESITTRSVPALKAYLQGEALLRSSDFRLAIPHFEQAVAADSTFDPRRSS